MQSLLWPAANNLQISTSQSHTWTVIAAGALTAKGGNEVVAVALVEIEGTVFGMAQKEGTKEINIDEMMAAVTTRRHLHLRRAPGRSNIRRRRDIAKIRRESTKRRRIESASPRRPRFIVVVEADRHHMQQYPRRHQELMN